MSSKPWVDGPQELLQHGLQHLEQGSEFDQRMALICIDNAVEVMLRTYLGLPKRATGFHIPRSRYDEATQSFPKLLDLLEEFAEHKLHGIELADIEWLHRLRNQLYHEGNGITVEKDKVDLYSGVALQLFCNLFDVNPTDISIRSSTPQDFIMYYAELETTLRELMTKHSLRRSSATPMVLAVRPMISMLAKTGVLAQELVEELQPLIQRRNEIVHGMGMPSSEELGHLTTQLRQIMQKVRGLL